MGGLNVSPILGVRGQSIIPRALFVFFFFFAIVFACCCIDRFVSVSSRLNALPVKVWGHDEVRRESTVDRCLAWLEVSNSVREKGRLRSAAAVHQLSAGEPLTLTLLCCIHREDSLFISRTHGGCRFYRARWSRRPVRLYAYLASTLRASARRPLPERIAQDVRRSRCEPPVATADFTHGSQATCSAKRRVAASGV